MIEADKVSDRKILVAGPINGQFDKSLSNGSKVRFEPDIFEAIDLAGRNDFALIAVVMETAARNLPEALSALRQTTNSKIVLLANMHEEPLARHLVSAKNSLADDYLISPTSLDQLYITPSNKETYTDKALADRIEQLKQLATTDELTGLKNRRYLWEFARQIIEKSKQDNQHVTLLIFDIDDFKHYNDVYSHLAGDDILKQAAILMKRCCREHDVVARIGGDEFAVVFWEGPRAAEGEDHPERRLVSAEPPKEAWFIANRFRKEMQNTELSSLGAEGKGILAISGGLASFPRDGQTVEELFEKADEALLNAKRSGKNRIYIVGKSEVTDSE